MTDIDTLAGRVAKRLEARGLSIKEAERLGGFSATFIHDIVSGKKATIREKYHAKLASVLQTNSLWLFSGIGNEGDVQEDPLPPSALTSDFVLNVPYAISPEAEVGPVTSREVRILGVDTSTCRFIGALADRPDQTIFGTIVDPEFRIRGSRYIGCVGGQKPVRALVRPVENPGGRPHLFILAIEEPEAP